MTAQLVQAVKQVREEVVAGETLEDAVAFIAEEYNLNPELLLRKVKENFGERVIHAKAAAAATESERMTIALRIARDWAKRYRGGLEYPYLGKVFEYQNEKYLMVVVDGSCHKWGIKAVRIHDGATWKFALRIWNEIAEQFHN